MNTQILKKTLDQALEAVNACRGLIILVDEKTGELIPYVSGTRESSPDPGEVSFSEPVCRLVLESGQSILISDAMEEDRSLGPESKNVRGTRSAMCAPIRSKNRIPGVIHVESKAGSASFSRDDLGKLTAVAYKAGSAIENTMIFADAHKESQDRQNHLLEAEKLTAVGKIMRRVTHEITNPMTVIMGFTEIVRRELEQGRIDKETIEEYVNRLKSVEDEAGRVVRIVDSMSRFYLRRKSDMIQADAIKEIEAALMTAQYRRSRGLHPVCNPGGSSEIPDSGSGAE